jgi:hypothetical protein
MQVRAALPLLQEEDGWGIVLFLYSLVLSNGLERVVATLDDPTISLMGMHGYCTQVIDCTEWNWNGRSTE